MANLIHISCVALLVLGGCSQIIGLSEYEIDSELDGAAGDDGRGGEGKGGSGGSGGSEPAAAGSPGEGGATGVGGEPASAGGPTKIVDCDSLDCCTALAGKAVGVELLGDGGFELGTPDEGSPWKEVSTTASNELLVGTDGFGFVAHTGDWYAYLSGLKGEQSTIYQNVTVPANAGWLVVSGYRLFQIDIQDEMNADFCGIGFYDPSLPTDQQLLELPFFWSKPSDGGPGFGDTPTWKRFEASWDALPHRGKKREIDFRGKSDEYPVAMNEDDADASSYLFDDLSLKAYRCEVPLD
jgi:hypothetical protein